MTVEIIDCEQGSTAWFAARLGIPTASMFATVMAKGKDGPSKTRKDYMLKLAGEVLTGEPAESYSNGYMERGHMLEDEARRLYALMADAEPMQVGFIRNGQKGASPDSLIGDRSGLEIKIAIPAVQIDRLQWNRVPPEHVAQVQGNLWVSERDTWTYVSYCPKLPPLIVTVGRDAEKIRDIEKAVDAFNDELAAVVASIRSYGDLKGALQAA